MDKLARIKAFSNLGNWLADCIDNDNKNKSLAQSIDKSIETNPWFTKHSISQAIKGISKWLDKETLHSWVANYPYSDKNKYVGVIMAGNVPLVGFHDFLSVLICGHTLFIRLSSKDPYLLPNIAKQLIHFEPRFGEKINFVVDLPNHIDAIIATGSSNTARYFEYYYKNKPGIIRGNRNSVAILSGNESHGDFKNLADDVCSYYGLGCRNVSKIYIPDKKLLSELSAVFMNHNHTLTNRFYSDNLKYQKARLKTHESPFIDAGSVLIKQDKNIHSPIGILNYETYGSLSGLNAQLSLQREKIQCIAGNCQSDFVPLGKTQTPDIDDYADNVDTMGFLTGLK